MLPAEQGRFISQDHLDLILEVANQSPDIEFVSMSEGEAGGSRAKALELLADLNAVLPHNDKFKGILHAEEKSWRFVAVKKTKLNAFNDRDGI